MRRAFFKQAGAAVVALLMTVCAHAKSMINMPEGVTPISRDVYHLHMTIFWICVIIAVVVFSVLIYSLIKHRRSKGHQAATFHGHDRLEILWAVIPLLILVVMAVPATKVLMRMNDSSDATVNIKVTGYQWKWQYEYLDEGISFFSNLSTPLTQIQNQQPKDAWYLLEVDNPLVVPVGEKIRFLVTSNDVIHSWWVPVLGFKRDAIPGFIHEAWAIIEKPGVYRGQCAELCGVNHAYMPIVVKAVPRAEYDAWVAAQTKGNAAAKAAAQAALKKPWTAGELMKQGQSVYASHCAVCHKPDGKGMPPAFPALKGSPIAIGPVNAHIDIVLNGKPGTAMQAFGQQLNDADIAAVVTYERNAWGNDQLRAQKHVGGSLVQPSDVAKRRH